MSFFQDKIDNIKEYWPWYGFFFVLFLGALFAAREDGRNGSDAEWFRAIDKAEEEE